LIWQESTVASHDHNQPRVFISYARAGGEAYAKYLSEKLTEEGIPCWFDREDLRRTNNWWRKIDEALDSVEYLVKDAGQRDDAVSKTVGVSLDLLDPNNEVPRLFELGIFPEDEPIPLEVIASLWQQTGDLDEFRAEELCERFYDLWLILELDLGARTLRLHDAFRKYFESQLTDSQLVHDHMLKAWINPYQLPSSYAWKWYGYHVSNSSDAGRLRALPTDFDWLNAKLNATDVNGLLAEFHYAARLGH
jgi:TIR domain